MKDDPSAEAITLLHERMITLSDTNVIDSILVDIGAHP